MKRVHFIGIGGSGASAVAAIAKSEGFEVTGCDLIIDNEFTRDLEKSALFKGHSPHHLKRHLFEPERPQSRRPEGTEGSADSSATPQNDNVNILAITPAILSLDPDNEELLEARKQGIEILTWQEFMGKYLEPDKFVIAVAGTHGKSTTTAMIGQLLEDAGLDPTVELGAIVPKWGRNYRVSSNANSTYFVTEADEFNDNFLVTQPDIAVVTNIEMDHPEYFKDFDDYKDSFEKFLLQTKATIVANISDPGVAEVTKWVMKDSEVEVLDYSKSDFNLNLQIPGKHNLMNAQAAFQVGLLLGIDSKMIRKSLNNFSGIGRRLELVGEINGAKVYSDFGHHPTEIKVTVEALKKKYPDKKLWLIFQPHMFSRTKALFNDFARTFKNLKADGVMIAPIYPSREKDPGDMNSGMLVEAVAKKSVEHTQIPLNYQEMAKYLSGGDIVLFMGAGDTDKWAREFVRIQNSE